MKPLLCPLVHGFNVSDPDGGIGRLRRMLEAHGIAVEMYRTGKLSLWDVRFANRNSAEQLLSYLELASRTHHVVPIGHSNGCALIYLAALAQERRGIEAFDSAVYLSPALGRSLAAPLRRVDVFHSQHDTTVGWARFLPCHIWGDMGRVGYRGKDLSHFNTDCTDVIDGRDPHSEWWNDDPLRYLRDRLANPLASNHGLTGGTNSAPLGFFPL
jgi:alpha-beta hydrolase superfamily lysophospholipase